MTAKRFKTQRVYKGFDGEKIYEWCVMDYDNILLRLTTRMDCKDVCEVLNSFHEENEQLKKEIENGIESFKKIQRCHTLTLVEENKQLKDFIDELYKKYEDAHGLSIDNTDWF